MKNLLITFTLICVSSVCAAHEIKELKVTKIWQSNRQEAQLHWMVADTVTSEDYTYLDCVGFNIDGVPLFQSMELVTPFATLGTVINTGGWNNANVFEVRCAYRQ